MKKFFLKKSKILLCIIICLLINQKLFSKEISISECELAARNWIAIENHRQAFFEKRNMLMQKISLIKYKNKTVGYAIDFKPDQVQNLL